MGKKITWRKYHKWVGLPLAVFILIFCFSGIILNHRYEFSGINISRDFLPADYTLKNFNNGSVKGTLALSADSILAYGNVGLWLTDRNFSKFEDFNTGFPAGMDHRNIKNVVRDPEGNLWVAAQFGIYKFDGNRWNKIGLPGNKERISDITLSGDSTNLVVLTRSNVYVIDKGRQSSEAVTLDAPEGKEPKTTLFKTFWMLHSGELFGPAGRIVIDIVAVIIIFLCVTGIVLFILPYRVKWFVRNHKGPVGKGFKSFFKWNSLLHDKVGYATAILTIIVAFTGMCLRPPLMIPLVLAKISPIPYTAQDTDNYWHDKLRGIRWDESEKNWLLSTSEGFIRANSDFSGKPRPIEEGVIPPVSPMGITVFEKSDNGDWLIGSFTGLFRWSPEKGITLDALTGKEYDPTVRTYGVGTSLISGVSHDLNADGMIVFDYSKGSDRVLDMGENLASQPMSLWNVALELHVGRCYTPFLGPLSSLFVFVFGLLMTLVLVSGVIIHTRKNKKKNNNIKNNSK